MVAIEKTCDTRETSAGASIESSLGEAARSCFKHPSHARNARQEKICLSLPPRVKPDSYLSML